MVNRFLMLITLISVGAAIYFAYEANQLRDTHTSRQSSLISEPVLTASSKPNSGIVQNQWDPFEEMERIHKEMDRLFRDSFGRGMARFPDMGEDEHFLYDPEVDLQESPREYILKMDVPGMQKDKISIEAKGGLLVISGEKNKDIQDANQQGQFYRRERSFGYFSRSIPLPHDAKSEGIQAQYENGVLIVKIPREEQKLDATSGKIQVY